MTADEKVPQGTAAWFEMVGEMMIGAANAAGLPDDLNVSFLERYIDGAPLGDGLVQGIRLDIVRGTPSFRVGAGPDERADVMIELPAATAREMNALWRDDPAYRERRERAAATGEMKVTGDLARLGGWLDDIHDPVVARTIQPSNH